MSVAHGQQRTILSLLNQLRPHWDSDRALPARIQSLLRGNRSFGSRDRRLYRELVYTTLRYLPWIEPSLERDPEHAVQLIAWLAADLPATTHFRASLIADWPPCPRSTAEKAAILTQRAAGSSSAADTANETYAPSALLPGWFRAHCPEAFEPAQLDSLLSRAPLWLRLQTTDATAVTREFDQLGWRWEASGVLPAALKLLDEVDATKTSAFQHGLIEVQDLGSQLLLESVEIAAGERWFDACAGAGGKTLQLSALLSAAGRIDAFDVRPRALEELAIRAARAGIAVETDAPPPHAAGLRRATREDRFAPVRIVGAPPDARYDGVLVDAPCSGSGTWRRAPHLKWTTRPEDVARASSQQQALLDQFSARVRPGGRLIYATCSLSQEENERVVTRFLETHADFTLAPPSRALGGVSQSVGLTLFPAQHDTDGFFVASLRRA
jgi:16S rRNA (cytosine967-C5)-methyltransferase